MSILYSHLVNVGSTSLAHHELLAGKINNNNNNLQRQKYLSLPFTTANDRREALALPLLWQLTDQNTPCQYGLAARKYSGSLLCFLTQRDINRSGRHVKVHECTSRIYTGDVRHWMLPIFLHTESHKALLIDSLILCCVALWQDAEAPCGDFKCQL